MSEQGITVTLKGGGGYDAPWIVLHGQDGPDVVQKWQSLVAEVARPGNEDMASIVQVVGEANRLSAVKAVLGATEEQPAPPQDGPLVPPVATNPGAASPTLIKVAALKSGKTEAELAGISTLEAQALIAGGGK